MKTKLTLTIEESIVEKAKFFAKHTGRSLSEVIENYLITLTQENNDRVPLSPKLQKIMGVLKLPAEFDEKAFKS